MDDTRESPGLEALAGRVGAPILDTVEPYVWDASVDTIRNFARSYGDDNPLYSDPAYAEAGPRHRLVAPPLFPIAAGLPRPATADDDELDLDTVGRGAPQRVAADRWVLWRPVVEGVRLERERRLTAVDHHAGFTVAVETTTYTAAGAVYATHQRARRYEHDHDHDHDHAGGGSGAVGERRRALATYTDGEIAAIEAAYAHESRRGSGVLHATDVGFGDQLPTKVKGPLTITDLVAYRAGVGPGPLGGEPLRLAYLNRRRRPEVYTRDRRGVPDITERRHWDEDYARSLGHPSAYDYSHTRLTWCSHLLTDWMGDGGWLWELSASTGPANYVGDTHRVGGVVAEVGTTTQGCGRVVVDLAARNQLDEVTCTARAVVLLPAEGTDHVTDGQLAAFAVDSVSGH